jgi:uncharacterized protein YtpQ (UPF0354 family)
MKIAMAVIAAAMTSMATYASSPTEAEFTELVAKKIQTELSPVKVSIEKPLQIKISGISDYEFTGFLSNAYSQITSGTRGIDDVIRDQVEMIRAQKSALEGEAGKDVGSIMPAIKPSQFLDATLEQMRSNGLKEDAVSLAYTRLNPDLIVVYMFDSEESMRFVMDDDFKKLGLSKESALELSVQNMDQYFKKSQAGFQKIDSPESVNAFQLLVDENYETSGILSDKICSGVDASPGGCVVFIPARGFALLAKSGDQKSIDFLRDLSQKIYSEAAYRISPHGYIQKDGSWTRVTP